MNLPNKRFYILSTLGIVAFLAFFYWRSSTSIDDHGIFFQVVISVITLIATITGVVLPVMYWIQRKIPVKTSFLVLEYNLVIIIYLLSTLQKGASGAYYMVLGLNFFTLMSQIILLLYIYKKRS